MAAPAPPSVDHTSMQWRFIEWVYAFGPLTTQNVMEYFSHSPYYDKTSINQTLKMQTEYVTEEGVQNKGEWNDPDKLRMLTGIEFVVVHASAPTLFIIHKRLRRSPTSTHLLAVYYVLHANIYQSSSLWTLLQTCLSNATSHVLTSLTTLSERRPSWDVQHGYRFDIQEESDSSTTLPPPTDSNNPSASNAGPTPFSKESKTEINPILLSALRSTVDGYRPNANVGSRPVTTTTGGVRTGLPNSRLESRLASPSPAFRSSPAPMHMQTSTVTGSDEHEREKEKEEETVLGKTGKRKPKRAMQAIKDKR